MEEPEIGEVQILLRSEQDSISMLSLGAQYISKLVKISGIIIAASRTKAKATYETLICKNCRNIKIVPCHPGLGGAIMPRSCDHIPQTGEEPCPLDPWLVIPDKSKYVDQQTLKLQENPEDVPTGELPRNMFLFVDRHLVQTIVPGTRLTVMGIYSIFQAANSSASHEGAVAVRQPDIRVVGIEETNDTDFRSPANFNADEIEEFEKFASDTNAYENICSKIAPSTFGHENVKKAVACLLFGGSRKNLPDGVKLRGDINVLLLGDPSSAKSQVINCGNPPRKAVARTALGRYRSKDSLETYFSNSIREKHPENFVIGTDKLRNSPRQNTEKGKTRFGEMKEHNWKNVLQLSPLFPTLNLPNIPARQW